MKCPQTFDGPVVYGDRTPINVLKQKDPLVLETLLARRQGRVERNKRVHFCGMVRLPCGRTTVFLPLALADSPGHPALTMAVLAKYGREVSDRSFEAEGDDGNCGLLSVIVRLSDDFRAHGLFSERQRILGRNAGKPDWARTIKRERAFPDTDVFGNIVTSRWVDSRETLLAQVQAVVITELMEVHGWWLDGLVRHRGRLGNVPRPAFPRRLWPAMLQALLPRLFSVRAIRLASLLIAYLRESALSSSGPLVFGLEDFHTVWEAMLRGTMNGVVRDINQRLPKAVYHPLPGGTPAEAAQRSMLTDVVLRNCAGGVDQHTILDAKYYSAQGAGSLPGWPDIAKQMFYEMALKSVLGGEARIRNCFVFPGEAGATGRRYRKVDMRSVDPQSTKGALEGFPTIETVYLSICEVMVAYKDGRFLDFPAHEPEHVVEQVN